jgi:hypothetical protein
MESRPKKPPTPPHLPTGESRAQSGDGTAPRPAPAPSPGSSTAPVLAPRSKITDDGLKSVGKVSSLKRLALHGSGATEAGLRALAEARPDLRIESNRGHFGPKKP